MALELIQAGPWRRFRIHFEGRDPVTVEKTVANALLQIAVSRRPILPGTIFVREGATVFEGDVSRGACTFLPDATVWQVLKYHAQAMNVPAGQVEYLPEFEKATGEIAVSLQTAGSERAEAYPLADACAIYTGLLERYLGSFEPDYEFGKFVYAWAAGITKAGAAAEPAVTFAFPVCPQGVSPEQWQELLFSTAKRLAQKLKQRSAWCALGRYSWPLRWDNAV